MGAIPSFDTNGDPELAARFPDTVGGAPLQVQSFRGDVFMAGGGSDPSFTAFLDSVGAELDDVSVAFGGVMTAENPVSVGAFRILGASEDDLEREFIAASEETGEVSGLGRDLRRRQGCLVGNRSERHGRNVGLHLHQGRHALLPDRQ